MVSKKKKKANIFFYAFLAVFALSVIVFLVSTNWKIYQRRKELTARITQLESEIAVLEDRNQELRDRASYTESEDYLEQVAREQLDMKKPGEEVVVIQKEEETNHQEQEEKKSWWERIKSLWTRD